MKKKYLIFMISLVTLLAGCNDIEDVTESTLTVDGKGAVITRLVEDFSEDHYLADELKMDIENMVNAYNTQAGGKEISIQEFEVDQGVASVTMKYQSKEAYASFNQVDFFCGSVSEAIQLYEFPNVFLNKSGEQIDISRILDVKDEAKVVIVQEPMQVLIPGTIVYVSENMEYVDVHHARMHSDTQISYENARTFTEGYGYVIYQE